MRASNFGSSCSSSARLCLSDSISQARTVQLGANLLYAGFPALAAFRLGFLAPIRPFRLRELGLGSLDAALERHNVRMRFPRSECEARRVDPVQLRKSALRGGGVGLPDLLA